MKPGFGNNVKGMLAADISALQTTIPVMPGTGALFAQTLEPESALENPSFPTRAGQIYAKLTLCDEQETVFEIVHLLSVSGDNLTVLRGQEGTPARSWHLADTISNFATRGSEVGFVQVEELQSGKYQAFVAGGTANALTVSIPSTFFVNGADTFALRLPLVIFPEYACTGPVTLQLTVSGRVVGTFPVVKGGGLPLTEGDIMVGLPFMVTYASDSQCFMMTGAGSADIAVDEWHHFQAPAWSGAYAPYIRGTVVRHGGKYWVSLVSSNRATPGSDSGKWQEFLFQAATQLDVDEGASYERVITPATLSYGLSTLDYGLIPIGGGMLWFTATPPDGWLEANGQAFDKGANPELAKVYPSGRVPDMRGYFPRGWAHGAGTDPDAGRLINSVQYDAQVRITGGIAADIGETRLINRPDLIYGAFKDEGPAGNGDTGSRGNETRKYSFDSSRVVRTAAENRPLNKAVMFIIKTDGATPIPPDPTPDAVTVSPALIQGGVGDTGNITAAVVPSSMAPSYPVTFSSSDTDIITVDGSGNWQITGSGNAYITASISTGMGAAVTVNAYVLLTGLLMAPVPDLSENGSHTLQFTRTPAEANEPVAYTTTDPSVATVSDGVVYGNAAGTATISATGMYSGITTSQSVTVTAVPTEEARTLRVPEGETIPELPAAADRAGLFVAFDGNGDPVAAPVSGGSGRLLNILIMTSSGTYTPSAGATYAIMEILAGGGNQNAVTAPGSGCTLQSATGGGGYVRVRLPLSGISSLPVTVGAGGGSSSVGTFSGRYASAYAGENAWSATATSLAENTRFVASSNGGRAGYMSAHFEVLASIPGLRGGMSSFVIPGNGFCVLGYGGYSALGGNPGHGSSATNTMSNSASGYGYGLVAREVEAGGTALEAVSGGPGVVIIWEYA